MTLYFVSENFELPSPVSSSWVRIDSGGTIILVPSGWMIHASTDSMVSRLLA